MAQLAIFGHATRGKEVIEILEMLGGYNYYNLSGKNGIDTIGYHIGPIISNIVPIRWQNKYKYICFTLEAFLKKYPYKVGNKVITYAEGRLAQFTIQDMRWNHKLNKIEYKIYSSWLDTSLMLPYKEETVEESIENTNKVIFDTNAQCCDIMNEIIKEETMREKIKSFEIIESHFANEVKIEFDPSKYEMVKRDNGYYVVKKQPQYPKTYEECCALQNKDAFHLATKEQRDLLFQKMKEAGYEWDAEKKELKKIDNEEVNGGDYGIDGLWHADYCTWLEKYEEFKNKLK